MHLEQYSINKNKNKMMQIREIKSSTFECTGFEIRQPGLESQLYHLLPISGWKSNLKTD